MEQKNIQDITELVKTSKEIANQHGFRIRWETDFISIEGDHNLSIGDSIALCHSELSEALEEFRHDNRPLFEKEIADEFIRLFHLCGDLNIDIVKAINEKMEVNKNRPKFNGKVNL